MANPNRKRVFVACPDCGMGMVLVRSFVKRADNQYVTGEYHSEAIESWACSCKQECTPYIARAISDAQHVAILEID